MRIIDADALIESIKHGLWDWETVNGIESRTVLEQTIQDIRNEPTIDAEPVRHGHWKRKLDTRFGEKLNDIIGCSECNIYFSTIDMIRRSYCPNCGAKMDEQD